MLRKLFNRAFPKQYVCIICDTDYRWHRSVLPVTWVAPRAYVCYHDFNCWKVFAAAVEFGYIDVYMDSSQLS